MQVRVVRELAAANDQNHGVAGERIERNGAPGNRISADVVGSTLDRAGHHTISHRDDGGAGARKIGIGGRMVPEEAAIWAER